MRKIKTSSKVGAGKIKDKSLRKFSEGLYFQVESHKSIKLNLVK